MKYKSNKIVTAVLAILLVLVIGGAAALVGVLSNGFKDWTKFQPDEDQKEIVIPDKETSVSPIETTISDNENIRLFMSAAVTSAETGVVSQTITAEITPSDAENKEVDWSISWVDDATSENISEYLTVTPISDGALTATVTCLQSFRGKEAVVTVTTREGGFSANCYISFVGKPSSITINDGAAGTCNLGGTVSYSVALSNVFDDVGEEFYSDMKVTGFSLTGTCSTATKWVTVSGRNAGTVTYSEIENSVSIADLKYEGSANFVDKFGYSVSDGTLTITSPSVSNVYSSYSPASAGNQDKYYDYFYGDWNGYADVTVSCGEVSATIRITFIMGVENVSVTPNIQF